MESLIVTQRQTIASCSGFCLLQFRKKLGGDKCVVSVSDGSRRGILDRGFLHVGIPCGNIKSALRLFVATMAQTRIR